MTTITEQPQAVAIVDLGAVVTAFVNDSGIGGVGIDEVGGGSALYDLGDAVILGIICTRRDAGDEA